MGIYGDLTSLQMLWILAYILTNAINIISFQHNVMGSNGYTVEPNCAGRQREY
jgi:hypothetical protein